MNEFIVLYVDKNDKYCFSKEFTLNELIQQLHLDEIGDTPSLKDCKVDCILPCVGKRDVDGNKIYAGCSIVEFDYISKKPRATETKRIGYFKWDYKNLCYRLDKMVFNSGRMRNLKIIDTIQENKLGLIK